MPELIQNDYYPVAWSLSIEEFYYIAFPLILINLNKNNFIKIIFLILILIQFAKFFQGHNFNVNFYRTGTFLRFDAILLGFLIAHFIDKLIIFKKSSILFFCFLVLVYLFKYKYFILNQNDEIIKFIFIIFLQLISTVTLLFFLQLESFFMNKKIKKFSLLISQQTYSIYLFHIILIYLIDRVEMNILLANILYILTLFIVSTLVYNYIEKPILKLRPKI